ncbi:hypothetical protein ACOME3_001218 [Neoechinorhynchus agilis]
MGLCRCEALQVTNLFCYEHQVNVCEECMISEHPQCIIHSYVQWLKSSDYKPICALCKESLTVRPTVRLLCYDVVHCDCLQQQIHSESITNCRCLQCGMLIWPPDQIHSRLAHNLRRELTRGKKCTLKSDAEEDDKYSKNDSSPNTIICCPLVRGRLRSVQRRLVRRSTVPRYITKLTAAFLLLFLFMGVLVITKSFA